MQQTQSHQKGSTPANAGYARPVVVRLGTLRQITLGRGGPGDFLGVRNGRGHGRGRHGGGSAPAQSGTRGS